MSILLQLEEVDKARIRVSSQGSEICFRRVARLCKIAENVPENANEVTYCQNDHNKLECLEEIGDH
jgi:phosphoribosyl-ATP pyrophosphohydrolase